MITRFSRTDERIREQTMKLAEQYFKTADDPDQMPVNMESHNKLVALSPDCMVIGYDKNDDVVGWVVTLPTTTVLMADFLEKKITEKQLLDLTTPQKEYEALYISAVFVLPQYRGKGCGSELVFEVIKKFTHKGRLPKLFAWIYSKEGGELVKSVSKKLGVPILTRAD